MLYHILAVGDVVGEPGLRHLERNLRPLQKFKHIDFTVVNGENASGVGLTPLFTEVTSCGTAFARKPDPAGNLYLIQKHGLDPARTLAVGDRELDILAGKRAGTDACLFTPRPVEDTAADYQIQDFTQLYALVGLSAD